MIVPIAHHHETLTLAQSLAQSLSAFWWLYLSALSILFASLSREIEAIATRLRARFALRSLRIAREKLERDLDEMIEYQTAKRDREQQIEASISTAYFGQYTRSQEQGR
jgi:hypothetical protein